jgi:hypothetical protein
MPQSPRLLRPSSNFTPRSISGLALWLDASDATSLYQNSDGTVAAVNSGDPVGYWRDKSGNNRHATQATAGSRPTVGASSTAGKNAVRNNGTGSVALQVAAWPYTAGNTQFAVFNGSAINQGIAQRGSLNDEPRMAIQTGANGVAALRATRGGSVLTQTHSEAGYALSQWAIGATLFNTSLGRAYRDGVYGTDTTDSQTFSGDQELRLLSLPSNIYGINGGIAEFLYYDRQLSAAEVGRVARYLATRWGITLAPTVSNADAQDWINRVYANGGSVSASTASAVNQFCNDIDAAGIRSSMYRANLFCGTGLNACLVPLYQNYRASLGVNQIQGEVFSGWTTVAATILQGAAAAPSAAKAGSPAASSLREDATTGAHRVYVAHTFTGSPCVISAYVKPQGRDWVLLAVEDAGGNPHGLQYFNLAGLAVGSGYSGAANPAITDAGGGWVRISVQFTPTAGSRRIILNTSGGNNNNSTTGDTTKGYDIWGVQLEYGTALTAYDSRPLGNTTDTNVGPFVSGDYNETGAGGGLLGNGSSKYLNTGLTVSDIGTAASGHMSVYHGLSSGVNVNRYYMGANDATTGNRFYFGTDSFSTATVFGSYGSAQNASQSLAANGHGPAGHRILSRETASLLTHYYNGSVVATNTTGIATAVSTAAFAVFAANRNGTVDRWHNSWIAAYSIGLGLNSSQAAAYRDAMQTFQTALGRNV